MLILSILVEVQNSAFLFFFVSSQQCWCWISSDLSEQQSSNGSTKVPTRCLSPLQLQWNNATEQLRNIKNLCLAVLEAGSPRSGYQDQAASMVRGEDFLHVTDLFYLHLEEAAWELCGVSFNRSWNPFKGAPPSRSNHLPQAPSPHTITLGVMFQPMNFGGTQAFSSQHSMSLAVYTL